MNKLPAIILILLYVSAVSCSKDTNPWDNPLWGEITITIDLKPTSDMVHLNVIGEDYSINWGDGNTSKKGDKRYNIYRSEGIYTLKIEGTNITGISFSYMLHFISIQTGQCPTLEKLDINGAQLPQLDVSQNHALKELICKGSQLTSLNLGTITELLTLDCSKNQLTSLELDHCIHLQKLNCSSNPLVTPNLDKCINLKELNYSYCDLLTSLDVSNKKELETLYCNDNQNLSSLKVNPELLWLTCNNNDLTELDLSHNEKLSNLSCIDNQLNALNLSNCGQLTTLECSGNQLSTLDLAGCPLLVRLFCSDNQLISINLTNNKKLQVLNCKSNQLTSLDISENRSPLFQKMDCRYNPIKYIWVWPGFSIGYDWYTPTYAMYYPK